MQVIQNLASPTLAQPAQTPSPPSVPKATTPKPEATHVIFKAFEVPTKADPQSVVQAQIEEAETLPDAEADIVAAREAEQQAQAAARTKSIMGMLPADPSEVTKLMSALAAATSAEAIADIKLDAQPVD
jgi:hypothetical protein